MRSRSSRNLQQLQDGVFRDACRCWGLSWAKHDAGVLTNTKTIVLAWQGVKLRRSGPAKNRRKRIPWGSKSTRLSTAPQHVQRQRSLAENVIVLSIIASRNTHQAVLQRSMSLSFLGCPATLPLQVWKPGSEVASLMLFGLSSSTGSAADFI
jgi:hypothetical protein